MGFGETESDSSSDSSELDPHIFSFRITLKRSHVNGSGHGVVIIFLNTKFTLNMHTKYDVRSYATSSLLFTVLLKTLDADI